MMIVRARRAPRAPNNAGRAASRSLQLAALQQAARRRRPAVRAAEAAAGSDRASAAQHRRRTQAVDRRRRAGAVSVRRADAAALLPAARRCSCRRKIPTTRISGSISASSIPRSAARAISNAPSWPSRRRASASRCSGCGRRSTTRSSRPRCCRQRAGALAATIADLETRLRETTARVNGGAALAGDAAAVEATLLQRRQDEAELRANRAAALARLSGLTARPIAETTRPRAARSSRRVAQAPHDAEHAGAARVRAVCPRARPRGPAAGDRRRADTVARVGVRPRRLRASGAQLHQRSVRVVRPGRRAAAVEALGLGAATDASARRSRSSADRRGRRSGVHEDRRPRHPIRISPRSIVCAETLALDDRIIALREQIDRTTERGSARAW